MKVLYRVHRGVKRQGNTAGSSSRYETLSIEQNRLTGLSHALGVSSCEEGMVLINGRLVTDFSTASLSEGDRVDFFPPLMGG